MERRANPLWCDVFVAWLLCQRPDPRRRGGASQGAGLMDRWKSALTEHGHKSVHRPQTAHNTAQNTAWHGCTRHSTARTTDHYSPPLHWTVTEHINPPPSLSAWKGLGFKCWELKIFFRREGRPSTAIVTLFWSFVCASEWSSETSLLKWLYVRCLLEDQLTCCSLGLWKQNSSPLYWHAVRHCATQQHRALFKQKWQQRLGFLTGVMKFIRLPFSHSPLKFFFFA